MILYAAAANAWFDAFGANGLDALLPSTVVKVPYSIVGSDGYALIVFTVNLVSVTLMSREAEWYGVFVLPWWIRIRVDVLIGDVVEGVEASFVFATALDEAKELVIGAPSAR